MVVYNGEQMFNLSPLIIYYHTQTHRHLHLIGGNVAPVAATIEAAQ